MSLGINTQNNSIGFGRFVNVIKFGEPSSHLGLPPDKQVKILSRLASISHGLVDTTKSLMHGENHFVLGLRNGDTVELTGRQIVYNTSNTRIPNTASIQTTFVPYTEAEISQASRKDSLSQVNFLLTQVSTHFQDIAKKVFN